MKLLFAVAISYLLASSHSAEVRLVDLDPEDAAQHINSQDQSLKYAPKVESNKPGVRYIYDHPEQVVEDIYLANQYHGQDGLGAYVYGYSVPDIAKTEKKERSGDLKGAYNYISGNGKEIKVQYWDDGTGFHQTDNLPEVLPQQVEDSPAVKAAKEEHLRIWQEQAIRNSQAPEDPNANYWNQQASQHNSVQQYAPQATQQHNQYDNPPPQYATGSSILSASPPGAPSSGPVYNAPQPYGNAGPSQGNYLPPVNAGPPQYSAGSSGSPSSPQGSYLPPHNSGPPQYSSGSSILAASVPGSNDYSAQPTNQQGSYASPPSGAQGKQGQEEEEQGPPKGFFYSFDYPVGIIVGKEDAHLKAYASGGTVEDVYNNQKQQFTRQIRGEAAAPKGASSSYHVQA